MKNFFLATNALLVVAVIVLFVLVLGAKPQQVENKPAVSGTSLEQLSTLPIAYVNLDSLLMEYEFAKEANDLLMKRGEDSRLSLNTKARQLQKEIEDFQRKIESNAFLSRERAESEQARLAKKQQELQDLEAKLSNDLFAEQQKISVQLSDTLQNFLKEYNSDNRYQMILSNTGNANILQANRAYNITSEIVEALNKRFVKK